MSLFADVNEWCAEQVERFPMAMGIHRQMAEECRKGKRKYCSSYSKCAYMYRPPVNGIIGIWPVCQITIFEAYEKAAVQSKLELFISQTHD